MPDVIRTCVACARKASKLDLERFVARTGRVVHDPNGHASGRGAYTCRHAECVYAASRSGGFARGLRARVEPDAEVGQLFEPG